MQKSYTPVVELVQFLPLIIISFGAVFYITAGLGASYFAFAALVYSALFLFSPKVAFLSYCVSLFFQSSLISWVSPIFDDRSQLSVVQGLNFITLSLLALISIIFLFYNGYFKKNHYFRKDLRLVFVCSLLAFFYFAYGVQKNGAVNALIYFRNVVAVPMLICVGWYLGRRMRVDIALYYISFLLSSALVYGLIELFFARELYSALNADTFFSLKFDGRYTINTLDDLLEFARRPFLNLAVLKEVGLETFRVSGPNMHSISYAYIMSFAVMFFFVRGNFLRALASIVILLSVQAKGPIIVLILAFVGLYLIGRADKKGWWLFVGLIASYVVAAYIIGVQTRDFHVIGFRGGLLGFVANPVGYGLGAGGNLARESFSWSDFQNAGAAAFGVESAIGVMLYQIGAATFIFVFCFLRYAVKSYKALSNSLVWEKYRIVPLMAFVTIFNGIFQEEAYNPFALGMLFLIQSMLVSSLHQFGREDVA